MYPSVPAHYQFFLEQPLSFHLLCQIYFELTPKSSIMKLPIKQLISLLPFLHFAWADITAEEASNIAAKAYGDFVRQNLVGGGAIVKGVDYIYPLPPTFAGVRAGTVVPGAVTNDELYSLADVLQLPDQPFYQNGGSYIKGLKASVTTKIEDYKANTVRYLGAVATKDREPTEEETAKLDKLDEATQTAFGTYQDAQLKALRDFAADKLAQTRKVTFEKWAVQKASRYFQKKKEWKTAEARYANYFRSVSQSDEDILQEIQKINELALNEDARQNGSVNLTTIPDFNWNLPNLTEYDSYNMPVYAYNDFLTNLTRPWVQKEITDPSELTYKPFYGTTGLEEAADNWFNNNSPNAHIKLTLKNSASSDWSELGHSTSVVKGSAGFFGLFGASAGSTKTKTYFNNYSSNFVDDVEIDFSFKGAPQAFSLKAGSW
jgi:hypothetical protein